MRPILIAAAMLSVASAADAQQRIVTHGPDGQPPVAPSMHGRQWGERSGGYWVGGLRAPGGYRAYHRPVRGFVLPGYWIAPTFLIGDWSRYGLRQPPVGYRWSRYYDDAVLVDERGAVFDSVEGLDWDRGDGPDQAYAGGPGAGYPPPPPGGYGPRSGEYARHDSGAGGALAGAAVGGAVGAIAGGRHDRLGGALIGGGAGALAGYAIDRGEDRHRERMAPPPYGAGYPPPPPGGYGMGGYPPAPYPSGPGYPQTIVTPGGTTVTTTTSSGGFGGGYGGGYYGPGVTTVTVQSAPVVTTTTVETIEDSVTYTRPVSRRVYVKRRWRRPSKLQCRCGR